MHMDTVWQGFASQRSMVHDRLTVTIDDLKRRSQREIAYTWTVQCCSILILRLESIGT